VKYVVWRRGDSRTARVARGRLALTWHAVCLAPADCCPVADTTLAGLTAMQIAQVWCELHGGQ